MLKRIFSIVLAMSLSAVGLAQPISVCGYVREAASNENLIGATVWESATGIGTTTNAQGFFSLMLPKGEDLELKVAFVGYEPGALSFSPTTDTVLIFKLLSGIDLREVVVSARQFALRQPDMGQVSIPMMNLRQTPMLLGVVNLQKVLQALPGVQGSTETSSDLLVRGGEADENLVLLDGIPLYHSSHFGGFFSVFNEDALNSVQLIKGDLPARLGGRLSSALDVRMKEGGLDRLSGSFAVGLLSGQLALDGPGFGPGQSFMFSARKSFVDIAQKSFQRLAGKAESGMGFHDVYFKYGALTPRGDRLGLSLYNGNDLIAFRSADFKKQDSTFPKHDSRTTWGNFGIALRASGRRGNVHFESPLAFSRYQASVSQDAFFPNGQQSLSYYGTAVNEWRWSILLQRQLSAELSLEAGHELSFYAFEPYQSSVETQGFSQRTEATERAAFSVAAFAETRWTPTRNMNLRTGLRLVEFWHQGQVLLAPEPRLGLAVLLGPNVSAKASYTRVFQHLHQLGGGFSFPLKAWVPATGATPPKSARQVAAGLDGTWHSLGWQFELYHKRSRGLVRLENALGFFDAGPWEERVLREGEAEAYGVEVFVQKKHGVLTGWLGLARNFANRRYPDYNDGQAYLDAFTRPWDISLNLSWSIDNWVLGANWQFQSGEAITLPAAVYPVGPLGYWDVEAHHYAGINQQRLPDYHRLDLGATLNKVKKRGTAQWNFSLYNAYNRMNASFYSFGQDEDGRPVLMGQTLFPVMPSLSYGFRF